MYKVYQLLFDRDFELVCSMNSKVDAVSFMHNAIWIDTMFCDSGYNLDEVGLYYADPLYVGKRRYYLVGIDTTVNDWITMINAARNLNVVQTFV